jgi:hypothetical protein
MPNLNEYVTGRMYDPTFFAPNDVAAYDIISPLFDEPWETLFDIDGLPQFVPGWSSYCTSAAAFYHPDVLRHPADGGFQHPSSLTHGYNVPRISQAAYPNLKTMMLEHHWNQNTEVLCNPAFEEGHWDGCEPYYFNHALASEPATLFYDLSTRLLPNTEVLAADEYMINETGYGLWSRDTPFGSDGYVGQFGYDLFELSHHVLTTDGILGRDTLAGFEGRRALDLTHDGAAPSVRRGRNPGVSRPRAPGGNATFTVQP